MEVGTDRNELILNNFMVKWDLYFSRKSVEKKEEVKKNEE